MKLSQGETIVDESKFVESHTKMIEAFDERTKNLHKLHRERLEFYIEPYRRRLRIYNELKKS